MTKVDWYETCFVSATAMCLWFKEDRCTGIGVPCCVSSHDNAALTKARAGNARVDQTQNPVAIYHPGRAPEKDRQVGLSLG